MRRPTIYEFLMHLNDWRKQRSVPFITYLNDNQLYILTKPDLKKSHKGPKLSELSITDLVAIYFSDFNIIDIAQVDLHKTEPFVHAGTVSFRIKTHFKGLPYTFFIINIDFDYGNYKVGELKLNEFRYNNESKYLLIFNSTTHANPVIMGCNYIHELKAKNDFWTTFVDKVALIYKKQTTTPLVGSV